MRQMDAERETRLYFGEKANLSKYMPMVCEKFDIRALVFVVDIDFSYKMEIIRSYQKHLCFNYYPVTCFSHAPRN